MAGGLILRRLGAAALALCGGTDCLAEDLPDPTRPPAFQQAARGAGAAPEGGMVLQSVLLSSSRKSAIINGESVELGGKLGSARVVKISESEVVLKDGGAPQTLRLFPAVEMTPALSIVEKRDKGRAGKP